LWSVQRMVSAKTATVKLFGGTYDVYPALAGRRVEPDSATSRPERVLATFGKPAWEVTREDVDRVVGAWAGGLTGVAGGVGR